MTQDLGASADADRACAPDGAEPAAQSQAEPLVPSAEVMGLKLAAATPEQLGQIVTALSSLIGLYADSVRTAQERYEKDCAFLASLMAELSKVTHFIARIGADALEEQYAQGMSPGTDETGTGSGPKDGQPGAEGMRQNPSSQPDPIP